MRRLLVLASAALVCGLALVWTQPPALGWLAQKPAAATGDTIAFVAKSGSTACGWNTLASSGTCTFQTLTGTDTVLTACVTLYNSVARTVSGINWDNSGTPQAMSFVGRETAALEGNTQNVELWQLINPHVAVSGVMAVTLSGTSTFADILGVEYSGVSQSAPIDSSHPDQNLSAATSFQTTTTVVASNAWLTGCVFPRGSAASAGAGTTIRDTGTFLLSSTADSNATVGTGAQHLNYTSTSGTWPGAMTASLKPGP